MTLVRGLGLAVEGSRVVLDHGNRSGIHFTFDQALRLAENLEWCATEALPSHEPEGLAVGSWKFGLSASSNLVTLRFYPPEKPPRGEDLRYPRLRATFARSLAGQLRMAVARQRLKDRREGRT